MEEIDIYLDHLEGERLLAEIEEINEENNSHGGDKK